MYIKPNMKKWRIERWAAYNMVLSMTRHGGYTKNTFGFNASNAMRNISISVWKVDQNAVINGHDHTVWKRVPFCFWHSGMLQSESSYLLRISEVKCNLLLIIYCVSCELSDLVILLALNQILVIRINTKVLLLVMFLTDYPLALVWTGCHIQSSPHEPWSPQWINTWCYLRIQVMA